MHLYTRSGKTRTPNNKSLQYYGVTQILSKEMRKGSTETLHKDKVDYNNFSGHCDVFCGL